MRHRFLRLPALALLLSVPPLSAHASNPIAEILCQPTPALRTKLETQFGSTRTAGGLRGPEQIMEVWTDDQGNWTMVVSYAIGTSCIVAMGEAWHAVPEAEADLATQQDG